MDFVTRYKWYPKCRRNQTELLDSERMPASPDNTPKPQISPPSSGGLTAQIPNHKAALQAMNGSHSPHTTPSGSTPSPPASNLPQSSLPITSASVAGTPSDITLGCNVRQLSKVKRFLTTLQQFGSDISPEVSERVHSLILGLVSSTLTIEEFHQKIQEVTNFPLRPFVIPFLKSHLPLLQSELLHFARLAKQSPQQYLRQHEQVILDPAAHPGGEPFEIFQPETKENGKRRTPPEGRPKENGFSDGSSDVPPPPKRHQPLPSPTLGSRLSPAGVPNHLHPSMSQRFDETASMYRDRDRDHFDRYERCERDFYRPYYGAVQRDYPEERDMEDEWKNIHTMLNCIMGMVEKTKRALAILQHRNQTEKQDFAVWGRRHIDGSDYDLKKRTNDLLAHYKSAEERVSEVRRRAEEAVNEVKRQAVAELQKAVSAAESKASELVAAERAKMERLINEARRQAAEEALAAINHQEDSTENCWNCGRKANETCSGCNVARYCGAFCQHKDWENHHRVCGQGGLVAVSSASLATQAASVTPAVSSPKRSPSPASRSQSLVDAKVASDQKH